jgi:hydroxyethylthiazole kinase
MCSSLISAFCGASPNEPLLATVAAMVCMGVAGEIAHEKAGHFGGGSFHFALLDAVNLMDAETLERRAKFHEG